MVQWVYSAQIAVSKIETIDANTLKVILSENPNLDVGLVDSELTVLRDMKVYGGFATGNNPKEVEFLLEDPLLPNTNYSLISVLGVEGSIDFTTPAAIEGFTASNIASVSEQDINTIEIIDDRTIHISYSQDLIESNFEYKLLSESTVVSVEKKDFDLPEIFITVEPPLVEGTDYILMIIDMQDRDGNYMEFDTGIYDFSTPASDKDTIINETGTGVVDTISTTTPQQEGNTVTSEENTTISEETNTLEETISDTENTPDLQAAGSETSLEKDILATEEVAMTVNATPDTGAATWVLILLTLIINTFYYFTRRKKISFA